jgi:hypothetical protein
VTPVKVIFSIFGLGSPRASGRTDFVGSQNYLPLERTDYGLGKTVKLRGISAC